MKKLACSVCALLCLFLNQTFACTTFCLVGKGEVLFGRNYDWTIGDALVLVNKRGVAKTATIIDSDNGAKWISKYGSVTFNQYGRENPTGGRNGALSTIRSAAAFTFAHCRVRKSSRSTSKRLITPAVLR